MVAQPVEWALAIYYNSSTHRATYGRLGESKYTKDYIQLSRTKDFLDGVSQLFHVAHGDDVPLTYQWPKGMAPGTLVFKSADRPHLKWETRSGAPKAWKMMPTPSEATEETIPGDPSHRDFGSAENEFSLLASRGAAQPYLMAIKLRDEPRTLHLRAYLANPAKEYAWADLLLAPQSIQDLVAETSKRRALQWSFIHSGGTAPSAKINDALLQLAASETPVLVLDALDTDTGRALIDYLQKPGYGLFFDPTRNHDAWSIPVPLSPQISESASALVAVLKMRFPAPEQSDAAAETLEISIDEVDAFREQIKQKNYEVADFYATVKTRGSAQKAFADEVKTNYGFRCAVTDIKTKSFLVASHIVPWSKDQTIRLDPSNGICFSLLVDCAFEEGYLRIEDDLTIRIDWDRVGDDKALRSQLEPYDGQKLNPPAVEEPRPEYLQRRRALIKRPK